MGRVEGKVALVTGAARGQGRSHAVALAAEGAQVIATDICEQIPGVPYPMSVPADLEETRRMVEGQGQRCLAIKADARSEAQMERAVVDGIGEFGKIDILVVNHGVTHLSGWADLTDEEWQVQFETNLLGGWHTIRPAIPHMIENGGGSIIMTASSASVRALYAVTAYTAVKHGVIGLMRALSAELGQHWIRVNAICPGAIPTPMNINDHNLSFFAGGKEGAGMSEAEFPLQAMNLLPTAWVQPEEISRAMLYLASDDARMVTGVVLPVDAGMVNQPSGVPLIATTRIAELEQQAQDAGSETRTARAAV